MSATEETQNFHNSISTLDDRQTRRPIYRRKSCWIFGGLAALIVFVIAVAVPSKLAADNQAAATGGSSTEPLIVKPALPAPEVMTNKEVLGQALLEYYEAYSLDWAVLEKDGSPQAIALEFVAGSKDFKSWDRPQRVQRYVLAVFYYSTFAKANDYYKFEVVGWTSSTNWLSSESECEWEGITCEGDAVSGILLREHNLSGSLPVELAFFSSSLTTIDLTENLIFIDAENDRTPFDHLNRLEQLLMEDNYVITDTVGVPASWAAMTSLKKLVLSYNILQGPLNQDLFAAWPALSHLEIESNFLSGSFPSTLLQLTDLEYLYMRRNSLELDMTEVLAANTLPQVFALWLDSNTVVGSLPSSISTHTELASISITNTTLGGSIPTEMGLLAGMRRIWLYQNNLTGEIPQELANLPALEVFEIYDNEIDGEMPRGVCQTISATEYQFKALTADCDRVSCDDCCTDCP